MNWTEHISMKHMVVTNWYRLMTIAPVPHTTVKREKTSHTMMCSLGSEEFLGTFHCLHWYGTVFCYHLKSHCTNTCMTKAAIRTKRGHEDMLPCCWFSRREERALRRVCMVLRDWLVSSCSLVSGSRALTSASSVSRTLGEDFWIRRPGEKRAVKTIY